MSTTIEQPSDEQPSSSILNISVDSTSSAILSPHKKKLPSPLVSLSEPSAVSVPSTEPMSSFILMKVMTKSFKLTQTP